MPISRSILGAAGVTLHVLTKHVTAATDRQVLRVALHDRRVE
jgi:hypothetical protein